MLVSTVELFHRALASAPLGLTGTGGLGLDWAAVVRRKNEIVESWSKGSRSGLEKAGIEIVDGPASFTGPHDVRVGSRTITAKKIILATGSVPLRPPLPGADRALTSDEILDLDRLPESLAVVGGGFIGMELGFCFARAGSRVTVLHRGPHVLPSLDDEIRECLVEQGRGAGMTFVPDANVLAIGDGHVEIETTGERRRVPGDVTLLATGRAPNTSSLALDRAGIETERGGVRVNDFLQSVSASHIYAAGDAAGGPQHSPIAWYEGQIAGHNAVRGNEKKADLSLLPNGVFTIPAVGTVGLTEQEARRRGLPVRTARLPFAHNPAAGVRAETEGLVKVVFEEGSDRLLGVHVLGPAAEDLVQIAAAAMRGGLTRAEIAAMHYVFPTLGGAIFDAMSAV